MIFITFQCLELAFEHSKSLLEFSLIFKKIIIKYIYKWTWLKLAVQKGKGVYKINQKRKNKELIRDWVFEPLIFLSGELGPSSAIGLKSIIFLAIGFNSKFYLFTIFWLSIIFFFSYSLGLHLIFIFHFPFPHLRTAYFYLLCFYYWFYAGLCDLRRQAL